MLELAHKEIAAIIPTHNRRESLKETIKCLKNQSVISKGYSVFIIVIADGCTDGTHEMLQIEFPDVYVVNGNGNWWYTKSINEGFKVALSKNVRFVITLNDDITFGEYYLEEFLNIRSFVGKSCLIGSASYTQTSPHRITFSGIKKVVKWRLKETNYLKKFSIIDPDKVSGWKESINLSGRGMFFDSHILTDIGLYDAKLVQYGSDTDFSYRAYKSGFKVFVSYDAAVFENEKFTSKGTAYNRPELKEYIYSHFNRYSVNSISKKIYLFRKHSNILLLPVYFVVLIISSFKVYFFKYRNL